MAITNKEIIRNQLKRINAKAKTDFQLVNVCGKLYLSEDKTFGKISANFTSRTSAQMIEYLAGFEDAINVLLKQGE